MISRKFLFFFFQILPRPHILTHALSREFSSDWLVIFVPLPLKSSPFWVEKTAKEKMSDLENQATEKSKLNEQTSKADNSGCYTKEELLGNF